MLPKLFPLIGYISKKNSPMLIAFANDGKEEPKPDQPDPSDSGDKTNSYSTSSF